MKKQIKNDYLGIVLVEIMQFEYNGLPFMLPAKYASIEKLLSTKFPEDVEFSFR